MKYKFNVIIYYDNLLIAYYVNILFIFIGKIVDDFYHV